MQGHGGLWPHAHGDTRGPHPHLSSQWMAMDRGAASAVNHKELGVLWFLMLQEQSSTCCLEDGSGNAAAEGGLVLPHHGVGWKDGGQPLGVPGQGAVLGGLVLLPHRGGGGDVRGSGRGSHPSSPWVLAAVLHHLRA